MSEENMHDHDCDCGCEEEMVMVLEDAETGENIEVELVGEIDVDGNTYKVIFPLDQEDDDEAGVEFLKVVVDENGEEFLSIIEDDDEWEKVADAWDESVDDDE